MDRRPNLNLGIYNKKKKNHNVTAYFTLKRANFFYCDISLAPYSRSSGMEMGGHEMGDVPIFIT